MPRPPAGHVPKRCAGIKRDKSPCGAWAQHYSDYCRTCNRKKQNDFKPGPQNPSYSHGLFAKVIPEKLSASYALAKEDPELLSQEEEVCLIRSRLVQLVERVDKTGCSDQTWLDLGKAKRNFEIYARREGNKNEQLAHEALESIMTLIDQGKQEASDWQDIERITLLLDKLKVSERRRLMEMKAFVTITEAIAMLQTITHTLHQVVPKEVADETAKQRILDAVAGQIEKMLTAGELATGKDAA